jgi:hypothetical protein
VGGSDTSEILSAGFRQLRMSSSYRTLSRAAGNRVVRVVFWWRWGRRTGWGYARGCREAECDDLLPKHMLGCVLRVCVDLLWVGEVDIAW